MIGLHFAICIWCIVVELLCYVNCDISIAYLNLPKFLRHLFAIKHLTLVSPISMVSIFFRLQTFVLLIHFNREHFNMWVGIAQSVQRLAMEWTVPGSNTGSGEIFRTRPGLSWGPPVVLYNGQRMSFSRVKRPGRGVNHRSSI